ncbi:MAG: CRISPR-associated primase-polymerase type A1 [Acidobacteriota bacterium]|jgi:hypothetical protein|nr:CRISPR-associated primase-polymerase type A1 [Acidobacteriota bacterium]
MDPALAELTAALATGEEGACIRVREALAERLRRKVPPALAWAELAERAGEHNLAFREYQRLLAAEPRSVPVLRALAVRYEERGDLEHAVACAERWRRLAPADPAAWRMAVALLVAADTVPRARELVREAGERLSEAARLELARLLPREGPAGVRRDEAEESEEEDQTETPGPTDADAVRFCRSFSGREGAYARQWWGEGGEGGYSPVREPFTPAVARRHLLGAITVGVYPVRHDGTVLFLAFDLDIARRAISAARGKVDESRRLRRLVADEALRLGAVLAELGLPALLEDSGYKGRHLWLLLNEPIAADTARRLGLLFAQAHGPAARELQIEVFPKQADPGTGLGNLIKLPLGLHRRTGRTCSLLDGAGVSFPDPHRALREHPRLTAGEIVRGIERLEARCGGRSAAPAGGSPARRRGEEPRPGNEAEPQCEPAAAGPRTWAELEAEPEIARLFSGCPVLHRLARQAESERRLRYAERIVLRHALGHSTAGVAAFNYLVGRCANADRTERLDTPLSGFPISCAKIRRRLPEITSRLPCNCDFGFASEQYPTPRLHLLAANRAVEDTAPASGAATLDEELVALIARRGGEIAVGDGCLRLRAGPDGAIALEIVPGPGAVGGGAA